MVLVSGVQDALDVIPSRPFPSVISAWRSDVLYLGLYSVVPRFLFPYVSLTIPPVSHDTYDAHRIAYLGVGWAWDTSCMSSFTHCI
jgi:hypothetical protein